MLTATRCQPDLSEMFVLLSLLLVMCLQRVRALCLDARQTPAPAARASLAVKLTEGIAHTPSLAFIHAPMPRLTI